jgi:predicted ATP-dependent endonuclease of OLD family
MKLNSLYIDNYKLLNDFSINFKKDISILIGINGSGKSSILEAIALIFSDAILKEKSKFGFKITYELRLEEIIEETTTTSEFKTDYIGVEISASKAGEELSYKVYSGNDTIEKVDEIIKRFNRFERILPSNIVIYYSGQAEIMKAICEPHDLLLAKNYREGTKIVHRPFFYFEPALFDIILISLLSYEFGDVPNFLADRAKIHGLQSITFRLKKPSWARGKAQNWWGAKGEVKSFLDFLDTIGSPLIINEKSPPKGRIGNVVIEAFQDEYLIITIIGQEKLFEIREHFIEEKELFKMLNALYIEGLWEDTKYSFVKEEEGNTNSFGILSEGEQQAITIKGLTELVTSENTLFLFDEPDTYLHPSWQRNFIENLIQFVEASTTNMSQFLITTHSPQLLSNANPEKSEVQIMEDGEIVKITPKYYGKDISTILYEMMGVERRNKKVAKALSILFNHIEDEKLDDAKAEFQKLSELLGDDDPAIVRAKTQLEYLEEAKK